MTKKTVAGSVDSVMAQGDEPLSNRSSNAYFGDILERRLSRRGVLKGDWQR